MSSDQTDPVDPADPLPPPGHSTSARNLLTVALRIFGFLLVCESIIILPQIAALAIFAFQSSSPLRANATSTVLMAATQVVGPAVMGIAVLLFAGRISRRFYPSSDSASDPIVFGRVGAGDLYYIASFMMGIYVLIQAVDPGVSFLARMMGDTSLSINLWNQGGIEELIVAATCSVSGILLIFGGRGIAHAMAAVPRNSDEVPVAQFSIRSLLILGVVFAVVLGVLRMVMVGIR